MRKTIANRMRLSLDTAAQASHRMRIDMTSLMGARTGYNELHPDERLSVTDILAASLCQAVSKNPGVNSALIDNEIVTYEQINIGVAMAMENGLVVPVVKNCAGKSMEEISREIKELAKKVKERSFSMAEISGSTITLTNLGMYGLDGFTAILNPPESVIIAVGATKKAPVVIDGQIVVRDMCEFTVTYDHRVLDGAPVAQFFADFRDVIEGLNAICC